MCTSNSIFFFGVLIELLCILIGSYNGKRTVLCYSTVHRQQVTTSKPSQILFMLKYKLFCIDRNGRIHAIRQTS